MVTTLLAVSCGSCGKSEASMRPSLCPNIVSKLFRISSGCTSPGAAPWFGIYDLNIKEETLNVAVGPLGK